MLFIKNFFKPGQIILPVPVGLPLTLKYSIRGILEKIYIGFEDNLEELSYNFFNTFYNSKLCPVKINVKGGTTLVRGVLYCERLFKKDGQLPESILGELKDEFIRDTSEFRFFAGNVDSKVIRLNTFYAMSRWMSLVGFKSLSHFIIPSSIDAKLFDTILNHEYPFLNYYIMSYMVYDKDGFSIENTKLQQHIVKKVERYTDKFGYVKCNVYYEDCGDLRKVSYDYPTILKLDILKNKCLICDDNLNALISFGDSNDHVDKSISCQFCGRKLTSPIFGTLQCSDMYCKSRKYPRFLRFINTYNLPELTFSEYEKQSTIYNIVDLFDLDPWRNYTISTNLSELLISLIPIDVVSDKSLIDNFVGHCNGNVNMFHYYINNTHAIQEDFHLSGNQLSNFIRWLNDEHNKSEIIYLLDCKNIVLNDDGKKFDGPPIFRNKTIMITGEFSHGSHDDIISILRSYSADVTDRFNENVDCVIIGSTLNNINSIELKKARSLNIPVFEESEFFKLYEIDEDLQKIFISQYWR